MFGIKKHNAAIKFLFNCEQKQVLEKADPERLREKDSVQFLILNCTTYRRIESKSDDYMETIQK